MTIRQVPDSFPNNFPLRKDSARPAHGQGMRLFACQSCANLLFFENITCLGCGAAVGFDPTANDLRNLPTRGLSSCRGGDPQCNWLVEENTGESRCLACRSTIDHPPATGDYGPAWASLERAKRRLYHTLILLDLPLDGLRFAFPASGMTGHADGLITVVLAEANDGERLRRQQALGEPMRTLIGHFRHESGHFYHGLVALNSPRLNEIRTLFGDEREDYSTALQNFYRVGAPADWPTRHVSAYAAAHPHEDWAETWAHHLHMIDALELAAAYGLTLTPLPHADGAALERMRQVGPAACPFSTLIAAWHPLAWFANSLNRSLGHPDWYPVVPSPVVIGKLQLIHELIQARALNLGDQRMAAATGGDAMANEMKEKT